MNAKQRNKNRHTAELLHYANQNPVVRFGKVTLERTKAAQKVHEAREAMRPR